MDNEFNKGINYAFDYIEKHIIGRVVNGRLEGVITAQQLKELRKSIPLKCDFCPMPCEQPHCCTVTGKECKNESKT